MSFIKKSRLETGGRGLTVEFNEHGYWVHGIHEIGSPSDNPGKYESYWGWVNHLRSKNWWSPQMELEFYNEVKKYYDK